MEGFDALYAEVLVSMKPTSQGQGRCTNDIVAYVPGRSLGIVLDD
jgi:hypothetical protein